MFNFQQKLMHVESKKEQNYAQVSFQKSMVVPDNETWGNKTNILLKKQKTNNNNNTINKYEWMDIWLVCWEDLGVAALPDREGRIVQPWAPWKLKVKFDLLK